MDKALFVVLLVFCSLRAIAKEINNIPANFHGRWKLIEIDCKNHKLGKLGEENKAAFESGAYENFYYISADKVMYHLIERNNPKNVASYCETIYSTHWKINSKVISQKEMKLVSRDGKNGYKCYEPFDKKDQKVDRDWPYTLKDQRLTIVHHNQEVKYPDGQIRSYCLNDSDVIYTFKAQKD